MAKNINHLQHVKSSVVENGMPKLPAPSVLVEGELAVNYAADKETISLKNSSGDVVTFSSDNYYSEKKLGSWFIGENSGKTVTDVMRDDERIIAAALNDLKENKLDASAYTETDLSDYATKEWVGDRLGSGFTGENSGVTVTKVIEDDERAIAAALTDLDDRKLDASAFTESVGDFYTKEEVDDKLGADFSGTSYEQSVTEVINDIETVTAAALNDLNDRKLDASAYTPTDLSNYYDRDEIDDIIDGVDSRIANRVSSVTINNSTKVSSNGNVNLGTVVSSMTVNGSAVTVTNGAAAITGVAAASDLLKYADNATYDSNDKKIYFKNGNTTLTSMTIDATAFIKDGMVNEVKIDEPTSGSNSGVTCLIVTFNTDAGKEDIEIPLSQIFDSNLYYTKTEIDDVLGSGFTVSAVTSSVTDVIRENELIVASALNDLESKKLDASAYTPTDLSDYATEEWVNDRLGSGFTDSSVTEVFNETEEVIAEALADLDSRISGNTTYITQVNAKADTIARSLSGYTPSGYSYSKGEVDVKLADKLDTSAYTPTDLSGYYTKQDIDEDKLGSGFTGDNSGTTVTDAFNVVERVVAASLTDLDDRKLDASAYTETDLSDYYNKEAIDDKLGEWFSGSSSVTQVLREDELAISSALNDLNDRKLDASAYTEPDLSSYATKQWVKDDVLGSGFTGNNSGRTITEVIEDNELITSAALNDLNERIDEISGSSSGGGNVLFIYGGFDVSDPSQSTFDFSDYTYSELETAINSGNFVMADDYGFVWRLQVANYGMHSAYIFTNINTVSDAYLSVPTISVYDNNGDIAWQASYSNIGSGGGGEMNVITGVSVNGTAIAPTNKVANITSVPASIVTTSATRTFVSSDEKSVWNGKQNALSNASVLSGITSQKVTNWDNAYTSAHSHSNKSVLDGIDTTKVGNWDNAATNAHNHDNKTILDNLTQAVIDNNHTHSNKTVLDGITTAKTAQWDNAISAVSFNGTNATVTNHKAAITATIPTSLSQLTSAHTHAISEVTNLQSTLNAKVSGITVNSGSKVTPTNGVANLTINASTVGALASGTTLDGIADGTTRKLSDYATTGIVNTHTGNTAIHLPAVTAADNGKILMVVNGQWALVNPTTIYTGTGTPQSTQGNNGDIYLQTS